ncbi:SpoIIE family protein phosphatase [Nonomuraea sp. NPDC050451]|uniref:SpoIIE family protein phosphatase n=1 Tax=Nonomuraea sp. NPDC050451 TaxID=3364364 RepID=UPI00379D07A2
MDLREGGTVPDPGMEALLAAGGSVGALMREHDWAATPFGGMDGWPQSLRSSLSICLTSAFPMVIFWGPRLALVYNDAYLSVLGTKHPLSLGQPAEECWREIWPTIGPMLGQVLYEGKATYAHDLLLVLERSGFREEGYFRFSYSPIRDESGGVGGVFCAVTETTQSVVAERRLATVRELGERSITASPSAAQVCEQAARVLSRNPADVPFALLYLLEGERAELAGTVGLTPGGELSPTRVDLEGQDVPWSLAAARAGIVEVAYPGAPLLTALGRAGFDAPVRALVLPIARPGAEEPAGLLVAGVNSGRPLDESCRNFAALMADHVSAAIANATAFEAERHRAEQLAALDRAKTMFFSNISHEFRTPLTLLLGPVEDLLEGDAWGQDDRERLQLIHRGALRLLKLVNTLLDFSRAEAGQMRPRLEPVDLAALTSELAGLFQVPVERGGLRLSIDCPPLPLPVLVDPDMWEKITLNLLSNAFKFTLDGEITVSLRALGDHVRLVVADTGVGIPANDVPRLFDRFHRVSGTAARSGEGSGIGLSLVRELVQLHGGTIEADSTLGVGSAFTVLLPYGTDQPPTASAGPAQAGEPEAAELDAPPAATADGQQAARAYLQEALSWTPQDAAGQAEGPEVLLVDDNADMRAYLTRVLSPHWRVRSVADGRQALEAVGHAVPDLVLTDVMMPYLDGFGLLKALRADENTRHIPVIMISARAGQESAIEGLDAGADDYLVKPFTTAELVARVRTHLETARQRLDAADRIQKLADISQQLNASLDPLRISGILAEQLVPAYAGSCAIWLQPDPEEPDRRALYLAHSTEDSAEDSSEPPRFGFADVEERDRRVTHLTHRDRHVGVVCLAGLTRAGHDPRERPYLAELLDRAAQALDNAARYARQRRIAVRLQRSLLPPSLPVLEYGRLVSLYLPGAAGHQVGGDWYDAVELPDGRISLTIGDVMGKGVEAAALMGQLRSATRAYTLDGMSPAALLEGLSLFLTAGGQHGLTTMCHALYDPANGRLELANAGHLPPLLAGGDGVAEPLPVHHGLALGVDPNFRYTTETFTLPAGSTLLLYTDGLVETPADLLDDRLTQLCRSMAVQHVPEALCENLVTAMRIDTAHDDVAMLALILQPPA